MKNGFRIMDSDIHLMEPPDMYERYLEDRFVPDAPEYLPLEGRVYGSWLLKMPGQKERIPQTIRSMTAAGPRVQRFMPLIKDALEDGYGPASTLRAMDV